MHQQCPYNISPQPWPFHTAPQFSLWTADLPKLNAQYHCPPLCDPTDSTVVYTPLISHNPNYPYYPLPAQSLRSHPPSPACHPISPIQALSTRTEIHWEGGMGWITAASHEYPEAVSAWAHPALASNPNHSPGTRLTLIQSLYLCSL